MFARYEALSKRPLGEHFRGLLAFLYLHSGHDQVFQHLYKFIVAMRNESACASFAGYPWRQRGAHAEP
jgi:hypothetical protein